MGKVGIAILGAIIGGATATIGVIWWFGWGDAYLGQSLYVDPTRGDFVDLLLVLIAVFLAALGVAVTVGALVVGLVALKTLREIKDDASVSARDAAADKITETLPPTLETTLKNSGLVHTVMTEMAKRGQLDEVLERVATRIQAVGNGSKGEPEPEQEFTDDGGNGSQPAEREKK
jgi:hypothetical protein